MTATLVPAMEPGSPDWYRYMTASKISAVMGLSAYESPFSLWHRMSGQIPPEPDSDILRRGHYLEPAIRAWFADQHPYHSVETTGTWVNTERPWQAASPDALVRYSGDIDALAEFKTAHEDEHWGQAGTDDIPIGYRCQVMWQMDTLGVDTCFVAALTRHLEFAEYVVHWNETEALILRDHGQLFMATLAAGERPDIDTHSQTYEAIRALHPKIIDGDVELDEATAREFCEAQAALKNAQQTEKRARSLVADELGDAKRAVFAGHTIARRQAKGDGAPYIVAGTNLPNLSPEAVES